MPRGRLVQYHHCEGCGVRLVPQRAWNAAGAEERADMKHDGYARQGVGPYCTKHTVMRARKA